MASTSFHFSLFLLIITIFSSSKLAIAANNTQNFHYFCDFNNRGNFTNNSTYQTNLKTLLSSLTSNTQINYGFYNFSNGQNTNKVNAIALCRGDVKNQNDCLSCLKASSNNLTQLCPNQKEAIGWYEDEKCMLRYSDRSIFRLLETGPAYYAHNLANATDLSVFNETVRNLLDNLTQRASSGDSSLKYAADSARGPNDQTIYGLVQCTPDLSESDCSSCLDQSIARIPIDCCKDKIGGRVVRPSCNMRFETNFRFYVPTATPPPPPPSSTNNTSSPPPPGKSKTTTIIAIVVSVVAIVVLILIFIYLRARKRSKRLRIQEEEEEDDDDADEIEISASLQFKLDTIRDATNDFSDQNKLGQGGFGTVYKGTLPNGQEIGVKRLSKDSGQGYLEFKNEVVLVAKLQHRNLVRLLGFCIEGRERLLVYEYVHNKSLDYFIFDETKRACLNWERRYKIIAGIARGILYLHEDSRLRIIHRDLKASNILLDGEMNPKIADFGMARLFAVDQTQENTNRIVGTYGYMAPEYAMHGQFSVKSDVFSFGVLILEIISGHKNSGVRRGDTNEYLLSFVWRNWRDGSPTNIIDPTIINDSVNEVLRCIHIGLLCVQENASSRPTMASVVLMLNSHSLSLPRPSEPAFYVGSGAVDFQDIMMQSSEHNSGQESINQVSITELYPR
ncbi:cysteine-rich receptor-like protein kinase 44 isoform X2 [Vicia villosa]|uniref:cysteine-rich receptor-like protein kinase 44 isoform X2 n=1 Tax=Vicia villosa TaxID=3911 RepID=UPI00273CBDD0|nr:cysteine-rich receptor-like protein kinase 44 isoform X2 [Vicia villosa]